MEKNTQLEGPRQHKARGGRWLLISPCQFTRSLPFLIGEISRQLIMQPHIRLHKTHKVGAAKLPLQPCDAQQLHQFLATNRRLRKDGHLRQLGEPKRRWRLPTEVPRKNDQVMPADRQYLRGHDKETAFLPEGLLKSSKIKYDHWTMFRLPLSSWI